ncbi:hypothetical protein FSP39_008884 [Pinctada imbricata]|uniref:Integrase catalytic domain-containing protein n=1 Tax=Pinctada imbricata TaxID=66713 RepID=A0AA89BLY5_PINIB|nr:hypothetical protein FSP39_008884 [Pinctada imbricata]
MADAEMIKVLKKIGLEHTSRRFQDEKITPDIVGKLSSSELQILGVHNTSDMMKLRTECVKHGPCKPPKLGANGGAPEYHIPRSSIESLLENGFKISDISKLLSVSERTIYRRMAKYGLSNMTFSDISDDELDCATNRIILGFPFCGENMIKEMLKQQGIRVQRWRLRDSIHRLDSGGVEERKRGRLHRRVYNVVAPNHLWHIDTNHKLIRWRFVIIGGIDGFSRRIMFLKCSDNNKASTVLQHFLNGVERYGCPNRVRSDKGLENVGVADFMLASKGRGGMITGRSTHNQRIERLWRDVFEGVLNYFYNLFYYMEDLGVLDCLNPNHLLALQYIYIESINMKLSIWTRAWDGHRMRTTRSSPLALWISGQLQNPVGIELDNHQLEQYGVEGVITTDHPEVEDGERPIFGPISLVLSDNCKETLASEVPSPRFDVNFGIDDYRTCVRIINRFHPST